MQVDKKIVMFDKSHLSRVTENGKSRKLVVRPRSAGSGNNSRAASPNGIDDPKPESETNLIHEDGKHQNDLSCNEDAILNPTIALTKHVSIKTFVSPPRSPTQSRPVTQPSGGVRKTLPAATSSRLTKPPVPLLSSRARRSAPGVEVSTPAVEPIVGKPERGESFDAPDCPSPVMSSGQYHPYQYQQYPGQYHPYQYAPYMMPYQMPQGMAPQMMQPGYYPPLIYPGTTLYGNIHQDASSATVVYTSGPIPPNTTSIIIVPMPMQSCGPVGTPVAQSVSDTTSFSNYGPDQPLVVFIERNIFKQWFDSNVPHVLGELPRIKRFKSTETFMHWLTSKKKYLELKLIVLVRVTEVNKLISELNKEFPQSVMNGRILKNVFAYEHLFSVTDQPGKSLKAVSEELVRNNKFSVSHCLEDACKLALEAARTTAS